MRLEPLQLRRKRFAFLSPRSRRGSNRIQLRYTFGTPKVPQARVKFAGQDSHMRSVSEEYPAGSRSFVHSLLIRSPIARLPIA